MSPDKSKLHVQRRRWSCGPAALRHALLCFGEVHDEHKLARWCNTRKTKGTSEHGLKEGARRAGYDLVWGLYRTPGLTKENIRACIRNGQPVILCTEIWSHWVCCYRATSRHVWIVDSAQKRLAVRLTWREILARMVMWRAPNDVRFDIYALMRKK